MRWFPRLSLILLLAGSPALAKDEGDSEEFVTDLIHSDIPLWGSQDKGVWPKHFTDPDGSFGCAWQVKLGDWKIVRHDGEEGWMKFSNYGVFHCYTMVSEETNDRAEMKISRRKASYFISLGDHKVAGKKVELWAIQKGAKPGSDYYLLSAEAGKHPIVAFDLLQISCPKDRVRKGPSLDILLTDYCAINSKQELKQLALSMAKKAPFAKMTFEAESQDDED